jgi:hypothetical protein
MKHNESKIQIEIVRYIRYLYPQSILFSVPNGHQRNIITAAYLKKEGLMAGVSDLIWINEGKTYFLEVKAEKGYQSVNQKEFESQVKKQGFEYYILRSTKDFDLFVKYLDIK